MSHYKDSTSCCIKKSHKKSKINILEKLFRGESEEQISLEKDKLNNCRSYDCPFLTKINHLLNNSRSFSFNLFPTKQSYEFQESLADLKETRGFDYLGIKKKIRFSDLENNGSSDYKIPEINPLEDIGMHIVETPEEAGMVYR